MKKVIIILLVLIIENCFSLSTNKTDILRSGHNNYLQGKYLAALENFQQILEHKSATVEEKSFAHYINGIIYNRRHKFILAEKELIQALGPMRKNGRFAKLYRGAWYELGQAQFALGKFDRAKNKFLESVKNRYQIVSSLYYLGLLYYKLGKNDKALSFFDRVLKLSINQGNIQQLAWLRVAEIHLDQVEKSEDVREYVKKIVLPTFYAAYDYDQKTLLAPYIKERIKWTLNKYFPKIKLLESADIYHPSGMEIFKVRGSKAKKK